MILSPLRREVAILLMRLGVLTVLGLVVALPGREMFGDPPGAVAL